MKTSTRTLDASTARELAVKASCDPRTIQQVYAGKPVRGLAGKRAYAVLVEHGFVPQKA